MPSETAHWFEQHEGAEGRHSLPSEQTSTTNPLNPPPPALGLGSGKPRLLWGLAFSQGSGLRVQGFLELALQGPLTLVFFRAGRPRLKQKQRQAVLGQYGGLLWPREVQDSKYSIGSCTTTGWAQVGSKQAQAIMPLATPWPLCSSAALLCSF